MFGSMPLPRVTPVSPQGQAQAEAIANPTREDLADLLAEWDLAKKAFSAANSATSAAALAGLTIDDRVNLDLKRRETLRATVAAETAYETALDRFMAAKVAA